MNPQLAAVIGDLMSSPSSLEFVTSSSSSDTDSDDEFFEMEEMFGRKERHSVKNFVTECVPKYSDEEFRSHFRLQRATAERIIEMFAASRHYKQRHNSGEPMSAEIQCLSFLWFAGNSDSYRDVSNMFNFTISSAYKSQTAFMEFVFDVLSRFIKMPKTRAEKEKISADFKKFAGIDNVLEAIDGSYIYCRKPAHKIRSTYINRHSFLSITLQGICDADKKFLDVFVGGTSRVHDSRIYKMSHIYNEVPQICGDRYHLVGDGAYPLREYMLKPYRECGEFIAQQKKYNKKHAQTRVKIENAFGLLKLRFRQLTRLDFSLFCGWRSLCLVAVCCTTCASKQTKYGKKTNTLQQLQRLLVKSVEPKRK